MMPIGRRLLEAKNDARMSGHTPVRARISKRDMEELEAWVKMQNRPNATGLPPQNLSAKKLWGMDIVVDEKVTHFPILEMAKR